MQIPTPRGLLGRSALIIVVPILLLQATVAYVFVQRHYDRVTRQLTGQYARELGVVAQAVESSATVPQAEDRLLRLSELFGSQYTLTRGETVQAGLELGWFDLTGRIAGETLDQAFAQAVRLELATEGGSAVVSLQTDKGVLRAQASRRRLVSSNPYLLLAWTGGASILLIAVALAFLYNQIRPIRRLARAAEAFGTGRTVDLHPRGAREVRLAAKAFLDMRERIERHIEQRSLIPMALSHDLRTPITRMRLALEVDSDTEEIRRSLDDMDQVVEDFLGFARAEWGESQESVDAGELLEQVAQASRGQGIEVDLAPFPEGPPLRRPMRAGAMRRCLGNLVENGARHGGRVRLALRRHEEALAFDVEDAGAGILCQRRERLLQPFERGPESADDDTRLGLGLAIARDIARLHGGELHLDESEDLGGLRATVTLPL